MKNSVRDSLQELLDVIIEEREHAIALDIEAMQDATMRKSVLLDRLDIDVELGDADRELAEKIRFENRRNAYLLWSALNWIRESMEFFGRKTVPDSYTPNGSMVAAIKGGRLLSGRV